ncbi:MAG TPA: PEP-CTERM sorting domain-containing protein [Pirellulales bacterium]|nr:PEP-CTERM sorting domain-containing protein [Pirellulales bacterium]
MCKLSGMKLILAVCSVLAVGFVCASPVLGNPVLGQNDDFQSGAGNWQGGGQATHSDASKVISTGGPAGTGDQYLQIDSSIGMDDTQAAPRLLAISTLPATEWTGDYFDAGVTSVSMWLLNPNPSTTLDMRIAFRDGTTNASPAWVTTNPVVLQPTSGWQFEVFPIDQADMTPVGSPQGTFAAFMSAVQEFRIVDSATATYVGDQFGSQTYFGVDDIMAVPEPSTFVLAGLGLTALIAARRRRRFVPIA